MSRAARDRTIVTAIMVLVGAWLCAYWYEGAPAVPVWDGWTWIAQAKAYSEGGFERVLKQEHLIVHAQHLYLLPSTIALVLGPLCDYSFRPFAFASVVMLLACGVVFYRLARAHGVSRFEALAVFLSVALFRHYENLLLGFQFGLVQSVLCGALALIVADVRRTRAGLVLAIVLALASAASSSAGIMACVALILVRWLEPARLRQWILVTLGAAIILPAVHFGLLFAYGVSFVGDAVEKLALTRLSLSSLPSTFEHAVKLLGGGLAGGKAATPVGLAVLAGSCAMIVAQVRRTKRIDALSGLAIYSLLCALTIAIARSPFENPDSRHEIFVAPAVGVCAIGLARFVCALTTTRTLANASLFVCLAWLNADARLDARDYRHMLMDMEYDARFALTALEHGEELTPEELAKVYPGPKEPLRGWMQYVVDKELSVFSAGNRGFEVHRELPSGAAEGVSVERVDGILRFSGPGHVYNEYHSAFTSGCAVQLSVDLALDGKALIGILLEREDGTEYSNYNVSVRPSEAFARRVVRVSAPAGLKIKAYVYAPSRQDIVRIKSYTVRILQASVDP